MNEPSEIERAIEALKHECSPGHDCEGIHVVVMSPDGPPISMTKDMTEAARVGRAFTAATEATVDAALECWPTQGVTEAEWNDWLAQPMIEALFTSATAKLPAFLYVMSSYAARLMLEQLGSEQLTEADAVVAQIPYRVDPAKHRRVLDWTYALAHKRVDTSALVSTDIMAMLKQGLATQDGGAMFEHVIALLDIIYAFKHGTARLQRQAPAHN